MKQTNNNFFIEEKDARTEWKHAVHLFSTIFLIFVFTISISMAAPPTFQVSDNTLKVESPHISVIKAGQDHRFHAHVINQTSAKTNRTTSCTLHVYNDTGYDLVTANTWMEFESYNGIDFAVTISGKNFTKTGQYAYVIQCNSTSEIGFYENNFEVTPSGYADTTYFFIIVILLFYAIAFFGFFGKNEWLTILGGLGLIILGIYMYNNGIINYNDSITDAISLFTIGIGAFFSIYAGVEIIRENL